MEIRDYLWFVDEQYRSKNRELSGKLHAVESKQAELMLALKAADSEYAALTRQREMIRASYRAHRAKLSNQLPKPDALLAFIDQCRMEREGLQQERPAPTKWESTNCRVSNLTKAISKAERLLLDVRPIDEVLAALGEIEANLAAAR